MNDPPDAIDRLTQRLDALERRVDVLEHPPAAREQQSATEPTARPATQAAQPATQTGSLFPVLGKAMLGIAGAYLLRAVAERGAAPWSAIAAAGIAYAFFWLIAAARTHRGPRPAGAIYAGTSALILAPMLWELTLRFQAMPATFAAGVLCAYAVAALALGWRREAAPVARTGWVAAAGLALALGIASHVMLPLIATLVALAAIGEWAAAQDRMPEIRAIVALAADAAVWMLLFVYSNPQSARADYPQLSRVALAAPGMVLFLISGISTSALTVIRRKPIPAFAAVQTMIAFLLAAVGVADFGPARSGLILGAACLVLAAANCAAVFTVFAAAPQGRNRRVFSAWSAALLLCGCWLCFAPEWAASCLGAIAIAAVALGKRKGWRDFEAYGAVFVMAAVAGSGLLMFIGSAFAGSPSGEPAPAAWFAAACAVTCYLAMRVESDLGWPMQALHLLLAALAAGTVMAFIAQGLVGLLALKVIPGAHHLAFVRTLTLCAAALALAFAGARGQRQELTRLGYGILALVAIKLVAEDLRHGHLEYIAGSIGLFAITLIAAPRVARAHPKALR